VSIPQLRPCQIEAHIAIEPDTGIIADCALTKASGSTTTKPSSGWPCSITRAPRFACWAIRPTALARRGSRSLLAGIPQSSNRSPLRAPVPDGFTSGGFTKSAQANTHLVLFHLDVLPEPPRTGGPVDFVVRLGTSATRAYTDFNAVI
jgi:hypothetical protein